MIVALLLFALAGREEAMRLVVTTGVMGMGSQLHGYPTILVQTRQPDAELVEQLTEVVPDAAMREELTKPHHAMSLRPFMKVFWPQTTAKEVESVIHEGTPEERLARFQKRYPHGLLRFSAVGDKPIVSYEWLQARIDKHGDFQLETREIHVVELTRIMQGWKLGQERSMAFDR